MSLAYYRNIKRNAKGRWFGKRLREIVDELGPCVQLSGDLDRVIRNKDTIEYTIHVHEPPITPFPPQPVIHNDPDFLVVDKPSGVPVHPTVNYYHHSVTELLRSEYGNLYPCYRLDRLTSGVLVLGKNSAFVSRFNEAGRDKVYYARVNLADVVSYLGKQGKDMQGQVVGRQLTFTDPIITFNAKRGYQHYLDCVKTAKPALTAVKVVAHDSDLALLEIRIETGRTHQIRKHLAMHGMPIHNDEVYANQYYPRLWQDHSEQSFNAVWEHSERTRSRKMTGERCEECGVDLYNSQINVLDLHCAVYQFGDYKFEAPLPTGWQ